MSDYALFQMWEPFRQSLTRGHMFYVEQAQRRLLSQFDGIEIDADRAEREWLEQRGRYFDPDRDDPADVYEAARDVGIEFYGLLSDMREQTRLSVVAGMFHEWDKQLRKWLAQEIGHWHRGKFAVAKVWSADFGDIADLLESVGWNIRGASYFGSLNACRLVVNVYKHGRGKSLDELKKDFPEYLDDPFKGSGGGFSDVRFRDHTHLKVSDDQLKGFSDAIVEFWQDVPENVSESQIRSLPDWFQKAIDKDRDETRRLRIK